MSNGTTVIAVAQRAKARIFRHDGPGEGLIEVADLVHPESRASGMDLQSDRPGRVHDRLGPARHAMAVEETHKEREASNFAREVAAALREQRTKEGGFGRLILVAEPGFLGLLRKSLDDATAKLVHGEVHKEVTDATVDEIGSHVEEFLIL